MSNFIQSLSKVKLPFLSTLDICIDLGTTNTKIAIKDKGKVLNEPTYIGFNSLTKQYIFFGKEASTIQGKTPDFIKIVRPMSNGIILDFDAEVALLKKFMDKSVFPYFNNLFFLRPRFRAIVAVPHIATEIEQKAVEEVLNKIGFSSTFLIEKSVATAVGSGMNVFSHHPNLFVNMGGGLIELAIISGGGTVSEKALKTAGEGMNHIFANYAYLKYGIILGEATCEQLKVKLLNFLDDQKTIIVRGKSLENGLPKSVRIKSSDLREALMNNFTQIIDAIKELIEISPPEIVDEIYDRGIVLTGGLADIKGIDKFFSNELKMDVVIDPKPHDTIINGLLKISEDQKHLVALAIPKI